MNAAILVIRNQAGEVRRERCVDGAQSVDPGEKILRIGTVTWENGESGHVAKLSVPHPITLRVPESRLRRISYIAWSGNNPFQVGDEVLEDISSAFHSCASREEYFEQLDSLLDQVQAGLPELTPEEELEFQEKIK